MASSIVSGSSSSPSKKMENKLSKKGFRRNLTPSNNASRVSLESQLDFERDGELIPLPSDYGDPPADSMAKSEIIRRQPFTTRRTPLRMDAQDGPWAISAAEAPHDPRSYLLYVKTPTHHLTLTRSSAEINSLHSKLRDAFPSLALPPLPFDSSTSPGIGKRRSSFLNTLSRLTSPGIKSRMPQSTIAPLSVPRDNGDDPFITSPQSLTTQIAAYLTALSNDQIVRVSKPWKRFVRVRTDDLESVRVERAIKRVRSDLAMHAAMSSPKTADPISIASSANPSDSALGDNGADGPDQTAEPEGDKSRLAQEQTPLAPIEAAVERDTPLSTPLSPDQSLLDDENTAVAAGLATATPLASPAPSPIIPQASIPQQHDDLETVSSIAPTTVPTQKQTHRIMRSASADPDKATRLSRAFQSSALESEDESSRKPKKKLSSTSEQPKKSARKVVIDDFEMMRVLGKGCAGKVLLVRHKASGDMYALKAITKRHVLAHQELQHTLTEQAVLKRMAREGADPFVVKLWWSFHDKENLFLVMDFHPGGDLATQLARWGRLGRDRARFYAAEIVEGVEGLHAAGVIYRDLKPENILIGVDGHIVLTDFGLSKEFPRAGDAAHITPTAPTTPSGSRSEYYAADASPKTLPYWMKGENGTTTSWHGGHGTDVTSTFCGTAEYLAPEVIQGLPYSYEVDWWSFGTMLFEMLTGITPFWANNHSDMYVRVLQDELQFPEDKSMDQDTRSLIRGLLQRNPALRIKEPRLKKHPYFSMIDWGHVYHKRYIPPYIPPIEAGNPSDTQNFDDAFLDMDPTLDTDQPEAQTTDSELDRTDDDGTEGEDSVRTPAQSRSPSIHPIDNEVMDVFDGYSFKGRHSVLLDDDAPVHEEEEDEEAEDELEKAELEPTTGVLTTVNGIEEEEEEAEAKTPEAKPVGLPQVAEEHEGQVEHEEREEPKSEEREREEPESKEPEPEEPEEPKEPPHSESDAQSVEPETPASQATMELESVGQADSSEVKEIDATQDHVNHSGTIRAHRTRREKSGVTALDRFLSDSVGNDADTEPPAKDEDEDWDLVEADVGEDRNGARGATLFSRGVVDRYRLAVFRKPSSARPKRSRRHFSGNSTDGEAPELDNNTASPSPSEKIRRGRNPGLSFRAPKTFLRTMSPPASLSANTSATSRTSLAKSSATISGSASTGKVQPSSSSLKSQPSSVSVQASIPSESPTTGSQVNEFGSGSAADNRTSSSGDDQSGSKIKKMKKNYKEGAEKVLSLFGSPRAS